MTIKVGAQIGGTEADHLCSLHVELNRLFSEHPPRSGTGTDGRLGICLVVDGSIYSWPKQRGSGITIYRDGKIGVDIYFTTTDFLTVPVDEACEWLANRLRDGIHPAVVKAEGRGHPIKASIVMEDVDRALAILCG